MNIGYVNFIVFIFFGSGYMILKYDAKKNPSDPQPKEPKVARALGWINISLGALALVLSAIRGLSRM